MGVRVGGRGVGDMATGSTADRGVDVGGTVVAVGGGVLVGSGVLVGVTGVLVRVAVGVAVRVAVLVGVFVGVAVLVDVFVGVAVLVGVFVGVAVLVGVFVGVGVAVGARISTSAQTHAADTTSSGLKAARASTLAQFSVLGVGFRALKCSVMVRLAPGSQRAGVPSSGECSRVSQSMWPNQYQAVSWGSAGLIKARYSGSK
jgi:hypothetical protein